MNMYRMFGTKGKTPTEILWLWFYISKLFAHLMFVYKKYYFSKTLMIILDTNYSSNSCYIAHCLRGILLSYLKEHLLIL